jgi:hypothetical protein
MIKKGRDDSSGGELNRARSGLDLEPVIWDGITKSETVIECAVRLRRELADFAKAYNWKKVIEVLSENPALINATRLDGHLLYTPLHQAAHGGASTKVVDTLLRFGAFRTLKTSKSDRAVDIAKNRSHVHLIRILEPVYEQDVPGAELLRIQDRFHALIRERARRMVEDHKLRLPELEPMLEFGQRRFWFAIPEMYGGFAYWLAGEARDARLISESFCRVVGGSGQRHEITATETRLLEEGFV